MNLLSIGLAVTVGVSLAAGSWLITTSVAAPYLTHASVQKQAMTIVDAMKMNMSDHVNDTRCITAPTNNSFEYLKSHAYLSNEFKSEYVISTSYIVNSAQVLYAVSFAARNKHDAEQLFLSRNHFDTTVVFDEASKTLTVESEIENIIDSSSELQRYDYATNCFVSL